ncbi:hypothetical protein HQ520_08640 [bacterium]|nr:hypothetical protein [bacterium]
MALGAIFVISPILGWSWPALLPLMLAVASGYGYKRLTTTDESGWLQGRLTAQLENLRRVSVPVNETVEDAVADEIGRDERLVFERGETRLVFRKDERGKFFIDILGPKELSALELRREAEQIVGELVQQFVYNRVARDLEERGLNIVEERVEEETGDIVIETRRSR